MAKLRRLFPMYVSHFALGRKLLFEYHSWSLFREEALFPARRHPSNLLTELFSPAKHEHVAGTGVIFEGHELLETQLFAASIEAIRAVNAPGVVIAT